MVHGNLFVQWKQLGRVRNHKFDTEVIMVPSSGSTRGVISYRGSGRDATRPRVGPEVLCRPRDMSEHACKHISSRIDRQFK